MNPTLILVVGAIIGFLVALLKGRSTSNKADATILDLTSQIKSKQDAEALAKANSDKAVEGYLDALKKYDPNFHNDGNSDGSSH